jgi:sporulation protein YunB
VIFIKNRFLVVNIFIVLLSILNIAYINSKSKKYIYEYSSIIASKITKYIVNNSKIKEKIDLSAKNLYKIEKNENNEINNLVYDAKVINNLIDSIGENIYSIFSSMEKKDFDKLNINVNILTTTNNNKMKGIILEIPYSLLFDNYLFSNISPCIPVSIILTGEFESFVSSDVSEFGINNALITIYINVKVTEQVVLPFTTKKITVDNKIPIYMSIINGKIPTYYIDNFSKKQTKSY